MRLRQVCIHPQLALVPGGGTAAMPAEGGDSTADVLSGEIPDHMQAALLETLFTHCILPMLTAWPRNRGEAGCSCAVIGPFTFSAIPLLVCASPFGGSQCNYGALLIGKRTAGKGNIEIPEACIWRRAVGGEEGAAAGEAGGQRCGRVPHLHGRRAGPPDFSLRARPLLP